MRVLIGCEFSQVVTAAFRERGHEAYSCDLLPTEGNPAWHFQDDVLQVLERERFDLGIFHPPCTYLSNAGAKHLYKGGTLQKDRLALGLEAKELFMAMLNAPIEKICIENPIPSTVFLLPKYDQVIQPFYFGHPFQKKTCLWLKNLPPLISTDICEVAESSRVAGNWFNKGGKDRQRNRAKTFPGIARAMAAQWSEDLNHSETPETPDSTPAGGIS